MRFKPLLFVSLFLVASNEAAKILVLQPFGSKSHTNVFVPLIRELARRDHQIWFMTAYSSKELSRDPNVRFVPGPLKFEDLGVDFFEMQSNPSLSAKLDTFSTVLNVTKGMLHSTFTNPHLRNLMNEKFDLVIVSQFFASIGYPYIWHFKAPFMMISPAVMLPGTATMMGDNEHSESVPFAISSFTDEMSFYQRTLNTFLGSMATYVVIPLFQKFIESTAREYFPTMPPLTEIEKNVSLVFTNTHPVFNRPRVLPPDVIEVGAMHCTPPQPLPKELEDFVAGSSEGFIIFAIGSAISMDKMPKKTLDSFISAFSQLPLKVIWQWKGQKLENIPENILLIDWLPQQDLLGHEKCRGFITHGGLNSIQEAIYHGIPILGLPFGTDQKVNMGQAVAQGYGIKLEWSEINHEILLDRLQQLLNNEKYRNNIRRLQKIVRDQPQTPLERAVFWTEHVIRHGGTNHLRLSSRDLNIVQRLGADVLAVFLTVLAAITAAFCWTVKFCCCRKSKKALKQKTN